MTEISSQLDRLAEQLGLPHRARAQLESQVQARTGRPVADFRLDRILEEMTEAPVLIIEDRGDQILDDPEVARAVTRFLEHTRLRAVS